MLPALSLRVGGSVLGVGGVGARARAGLRGARGLRSGVAMAGAGAGANAGRGALIVLEGLDRSGKSSQCAQLASFLETQGVPVEAWRFPDRTTAMGQMISSYLSCQTSLDDAAIHLLFSANRWEKRGGLRVLQGRSDCQMRGVPGNECERLYCLHILKSLMEAKLKEGITLVIDRYSYSGVAFSAAKGLALDWCKVRICLLN
ncbi:hypothetical protein M758_1G165400 [Ceratodon purpureus]|nr:hypothetical protein M758_1G165400 [Ceratodon purpureus]